jgi:hypothetical protein
MKAGTLQMSSTCPSCGHQDFEPGKQCACGYHADESFFAKSFIKETEETKGKGLINPVNLKKGRLSKEHIIKEIDSWLFTFSQDDDCICLSTPALQSFRLKLTIYDLEELLEFMYHLTGKDKTMRKLLLSAEEIPELIDKIHTMIEEKKSKIPVTFAINELEEIVDLINIKLKE